MPRKRGAQPGNKNAFRHGFYSRQFKAAERRALEQLSATDLSGEIEFVRVQLQRFVEAQAASSGPPDLDAQVSVLRAITLSADAINSMIRTQVVLAHALQRSDEGIAMLLQLPPADDDPAEDPALGSLEGPVAEE